MYLKRWEPFTELGRMNREIDRMWRHAFRPAFIRPRILGEDGRVAIDVYQDDANLVVTASLPGVKPEDVDVNVTDGALTIKGESKFEQEVKEEEYLHRERRSGSFRRVVALPRGLNTKEAEASYDNGILTVTVPKSEGSVVKSLKINVKTQGAKKS